MSFGPIYEGWDVVGRLKRAAKSSISSLGRSREAVAVEQLAAEVQAKLERRELQEQDDQIHLAVGIATVLLQQQCDENVDVDALPVLGHLSRFVFDLMRFEGWFESPNLSAGAGVPDRSQLWEFEDGLKHTGKILDDLDAVLDHVANLASEAIKPLLLQCPSLLIPPSTQQTDIAFATPAALVLVDLPEIVEHTFQLPFAPDFDAHLVGSGT